MPRFAILTHDHPFLHWDFLLEDGTACRTWRLLNCPDIPEQIPAESLPDHRLMYLDYAGPVSGGRGTVTVWDHGSFEWRMNRAEVVEVEVVGQKIKGLIQLTEMERDSWVWKHVEP